MLEKKKNHSEINTHDILSLILIFIVPVKLSFASNLTSSNTEQEQMSHAFNKHIYIHVEAEQKAPQIVNKLNT